MTASIPWIQSAIYLCINFWKTTGHSESEFTVLNKGFLQIKRVVIRMSYGTIMQKIQHRWNIGVSQIPDVRRFNSIHQTTPKLTESGHFVSICMPKRSILHSKYNKSIMVIFQVLTGREDRSRLIWSKPVNAWQTWRRFISAPSAVPIRYIRILQMLYSVTQNTNFSKVIFLKKKLQKYTVSRYMRKYNFTYVQYVGDVRLNLRWFGRNNISQYHHV
jgi:hypothetical protein